jgi:hypothetical protein
MSNVTVLAVENPSDCIGSGLRKEQLESGSRRLTVPAYWATPASDRCRHLSVRLCPVSTSEVSEPGPEVGDEREGRSPTRGIYGTKLRVLYPLAPHEDI